MPYTKKFKKLLASTKKYYTGKKVPVQYRARYGGTYSSKEAKSIAFAIAKKKGWKS